MNGGPESIPLVELLPWDSDFWGLKAARIRACAEAELTQGLVDCKALGVRWASLLVPVADTNMVDSAIRAGFQMVDVRVTMSTAVDGRHELTSASLVQAGELEQAQALVDGAFRTSRFHVDAHLDAARCNEFYRTWVRNSFTGELADAIVASRHEDRLDAFVTVQRHPDSKASLPLVAVRTDRRGLGVGTRVVADALDWSSAHGATRVDVVTQLANVAAIRLYESVGFSIDQSAVWLHRWFEVDEAS